MISSERNLSWKLKVLGGVIAGLILTVLIGQYLFAGHMESQYTGVAIEYNNTTNSVSTVYTFRHTEKYVNVKFRGWNSSAKVRLNTVGDQAILNTTGLRLSGNASLIKSPTSYPSKGDSVSVIVISRDPEGKTVEYTRNNSI